MLIIGKYWTSILTCTLDYVIILFYWYIFVLLQFNLQNMDLNTQMDKLLLKNKLLIEWNIFSTLPHIKS